MQSDAVPPFGAEPSRTSWRSVAYYVSPLVAAVAGFIAIAGGYQASQRWVLGSLAAVALMRIGSWWRRTFRFADDRLLIEEGILQRTQRVVPYDRIQQVDVVADVRARLLGAASVRIRMAGDAGGAVRLDVLPAELARRVQSYVVARRAAAGAPGEAAGEPVADADHLLLALSTRRLMFAGLMSDAVGVAAAAVAGIVGFVWQLGIVSPEEVAERADSRGTLEVIVVLLILLAPIGAALAEVYRSGGYRLTVAGDDLHLTQGLVETRRLTLPRRRVQIVTVRENAIGRRLGVVSLTLASATRPGEREQAAVLRVPILPRAELAAFLTAVMGDDRWTPPPLAPLPLPARRRAVVRRTLPLLVPPAAAAVLLTGWALATVPVALVLGLVWGRAAYRRAGHAETADLTALAAGVLLHRLHLVPHARLQSARTTSSPLQRRARLATLHLDVAGRRSAPHLLDLDGSTAAELTARLPLLAGSR